MRICSGFGDLSEQSLAQIFTDVCNTDVEADGLQYLPSSIRVAPIRPEDPCGGTLQARLGRPACACKSMSESATPSRLKVVRIKGSHHFLRHADGRITVVPVHAGETIPGLMSKILRDRDRSRDQLHALL